jgi:hypothetical protein
MTAAIVVCRNRMSGPTVIASDQKSTHEVVFQGRGDPSGADYQPVPDAIVCTPQFARAVAMGILEVTQGTGNEAVKAALAAQSDAFWRRAEQDRSDALAVLETPADNDLISVACIGPGSRPGAVCGENIPVRARDAALAPPLCARHTGLAERCIKRGTGAWQLEEAP